MQDILHMGIHMRLLRLFRPHQPRHCAQHLVRALGLAALTRSLDAHTCSLNFAFLFLTWNCTYIHVLSSTLQNHARQRFKSLGSKKLV